MSNIISSETKPKASSALTSHYLESTRNYRSQSDIFRAPEIIQGFNIAADEARYKETHKKFDFPNSKPATFKRLRYLNFFKFDQLFYRLTEQLINDKKFFTLGKWFYNPELQYNCPTHSQVSFPESVWEQFACVILSDGLNKTIKRKQEKLCKLPQEQARAIFNKDAEQEQAEFIEDTPKGCLYRRELRLTAGPEVQVLFAKLYRDKEGEWQYSRSQILLPIQVYGQLVSKLYADRLGAKVGM